MEPVSLPHWPRPSRTPFRGGKGGAPKIGRKLRIFFPISARSYASVSNGIATGGPRLSLGDRRAAEGSLKLGCILLSGLF